LVRQGLWCLFAFSCYYWISGLLPAWSLTAEEVGPVLMPRK
jgi:hypothetical protein